MDIDFLLEATLRQGASDLHLSPGSPPVIRSMGSIRRGNQEPLSGDVIRAMLMSIMTDQEKAALDTESDIAFAFTLTSGHRFRVNVFKTNDGPAAVLRAINREFLTLDEIGAPNPVRKLAEKDRGLILFSGGVGMGKTTTMAAMVDYINSHFSRHILTLEDPIEFVHTSRRSIINQRQLGRDVPDFQTALASSRHEDVDIIVISDMSDLSTIRGALEMAETGQLVISAVPTNSAPNAITRLIDAFPGDERELVRQRLANTIQGVVCQALFRRVDKKGRLAAFEILMGTPAVRNLIRDQQTDALFQQMQMGRRFGMLTMTESVEELVQNGLVMQEEALREIMSSTSDDDDWDSFEGYQQETLLPGQGHNLNSFKHAQGGSKPADDDFDPEDDYGEEEHEDGDSGDNWMTPPPRKRKTGGTFDGF
ncbi:MAG: type IV pilus twitching motility protein PilT [Alphaproteobacteria bacterium]